MELLALPQMPKDAPIESADPTDTPEASASGAPFAAVLSGAFALLDAAPQVATPLAVEEEAGEGPEAQAALTTAAPLGEEGSPVDPALLQASARPQMPGSSASVSDANSQAVSARGSHHTEPTVPSAGNPGVLASIDTSGDKNQATTTPERPAAPLTSGSTGTTQQQAPTAAPTPADPALPRTEAQPPPDARPTVDASTRLVSTAAPSSMEAAAVQSATETSTQSTDTSPASLDPSPASETSKPARQGTDNRTLPAETSARQRAATRTDTASRLAVRGAERPPVDPMPVPEARLVPPAEQLGGTEVETGMPEVESVQAEKTNPSKAAAPAQDRTSTFTAKEGGTSPNGNGNDQSSNHRGADDQRRERRAQADAPAPRREPSATQTSTSSIAANTTSTEQPGEMAPEPMEAMAAPDADGQTTLADESTHNGRTDASSRETSSGSTNASKETGVPKKAVPAAWLRAVMSNARRITATDDGWKVLEMDLDEGDGTVTIKARRDDAGVAVSVGFSDPSLRALAEAQAQRLQEALQSRYETAVDFSFFSGGSNQSHERQATEARSAHGGIASGGMDSLDGERARAVLPPGTTYEWVG